MRALVESLTLSQLLLQLFVLLAYGTQFGSYLICLFLAKAVFGVLLQGVTLTVLDPL